MHKKNKSPFTPLLLFLAVFFCGCEGPLTPQARQLLLSGYDSFAAGDDKITVNQMDAFLAENARTDRADEAYFLRGMAKIRLEDTTGARNDLSQTISETKNPELRIKAFIALGDIAYEGDDMALAENMYRLALEKIERGKQPSDHAHFRLGSVLQKQGRWEEADVHFDRVVFYFPDTQFGKQAARRTHSKAWTIQTGAFDDKLLAKKQAENLRTNNQDASTKTILLEGRPKYVVHTGRYPTYEQANGALTEVKKLSPDAFVLPTK